MQRVRLLFLLGVVLAVGATCIAKDQAATPAKDQAQSQDRNNKKDKAKNDEGHRKHWWSPPHLRHKKHDAANQAGMNSSSKPATVKPVKMDKTAAPAKPGDKTATAAKPGKKTVAKKGQDNKPIAATTPGKKTMASAAHPKKPVRHNCSPEEAKKGGCQTEKAHNQKAATKPS